MYLCISVHFENTKTDWLLLVYQYMDDEVQRCRLNTLTVR